MELPSLTPAAAFQRDAAAYRERRDTRAFLRESLVGYSVTRAANIATFRDWPEARRAAEAAKAEAVHNLDRYLPEFIAKAEARGTRVFVARDGARAREYILDVIRRHDARCVVKSKSMTGEEIHLAKALEKEGFEVVESDLGEFIVQLRKEEPFHIVFPSMHLKRGEVRDLFREKLGMGESDDPESLTMDARRALRQTYLRADVGISGVNFAIAETGAITLCTNEGNGRLCTSLPRIHIAIMGIEKVLPRTVDLALLLPMLATSGTGQHLTTYTTMIAGPRSEEEPDGPEEFHLVIMDNGRSALLADAERRDALHCIRCGACINVCPIFKNVGGHTYGTTYMGPIGSVITPHLRGMEEWAHLSRASSLCGACTEVCPVRIDLHHHLLENRRTAAEQKPARGERFLLRAFTWTAARPRLFHALSRLGRLAQRLAAGMLGSRVDPLRAWTGGRDLPEPPEKSFTEWWAQRNKEGKP